MFVLRIVGSIIFICDLYRSIISAIAMSVFCNFVFELTSGKATGCLASQITHTATNHGNLHQSTGSLACSLVALANVIGQYSGVLAESTLQVSIDVTFVFFS